MIAVEDVVYDYPSARALHGVSFSLERGAVLALVGPNGSGKSTLMRCIAALDAPTQGAIQVAGVDAAEDPRGVHAVIGYLPDFFGLYDELSVRRSLIYAARSRGVKAGEAGAAAEAAADRVQLTDRLESRAGELSRGLRQRLAIAQTLVHRPQVLLLDEPASGLDPEARRSLSDLVIQLAGEGMTLVISSHILAELEDYSTRMLMLREGRVAGGGVVSAGAGEAPKAGVLARIAIGVDDPPADLGAALTALGFTVISASGAEAEIATAEGPKAESEALAKLVAGGLSVRRFQPTRRTLEQAYLEEAAKPSEPRS